MKGVAKVAAVVGGLTLMCGVLAAQAVPYTNFDELKDNRVLEKLTELDVSVKIDSKECEEEGIYGRVIHSNNRSSVHLCLAAHNGDVDKINDTIKHEAWHIVQYCNYEKPIYSEGSLMQASTDNLKDSILIVYGGKRFHKELEAFVVADQQPDIFVVGKLAQYCG